MWILLKSKTFYSQCVVSCAVNDDSGIKCPVFSSPSGPLHRRQISDFDVICSGFVVLFELLKNHQQVERHSVVAPVLWEFLSKVSAWIPVGCRVGQ